MRTTMAKYGKGRKGIALPERETKKTPKYPYWLAMACRSSSGVLN